MSPVRLSLVIPCRDKNDPKLAALLRSIEAQDFDKKQMETLVITEGTSESAKAIGIRRATGEIICILASDNELIHHGFLTLFFTAMQNFRSTCAYPGLYTYRPDDDALNRYFSLIGGNDPLAFYLGKNDRKARYEPRWDLYQGFVFKKYVVPTIGDNGFFVRRDAIIKTDLDNYYHIDNAAELFDENSLALRLNHESIWHKTGGNIFKFFAKRYRYGLQHAFNKNRRWHLVDFRQPKDILRLIWFIFITVTLVQPLYLSIRGYLKIRDLAWFLHPIACLATLFTYALLIIRLIALAPFQSLSAPMAARTA